MYLCINNSKAMFKKSTDATQQDIFSSIPSMLKGSSVKKYNNEKAWHNVFRVEVVDRVNEQLFSPLLTRPWVHQMPLYGYWLA
jgi:hypothetical protein